MQTTAFLKFKHCNYGEHYAEVMAAYDTAPQTAWIASFSAAQRAYWAQQDGGLINGYAEAYAVGRSNAIVNAAQSAYATCMAGGASTPSMQPTEPVFRLSVATQLGGGSAPGAASNNHGLSTQLSVPFAPAAVPQQYPLDWRAFYRVGDIHLSYNYAENWLLSFPSGGGYTLPSYTTLPMRPSIHVAAEGLVAIDADYVQYIDAPEGQAMTSPDSLMADFNAVQSHFSFTIQRRVVLPDGRIIQEEVNYDDGFNDGALPDVSATVEFPALNASCDVSGTVDVYHFITAYAFGTLYKLTNNMQQVRVGGVDYDFTVWANAAGSTPPSYGPPGINSIHESFYFQSSNIVDLRDKLGVVRIKMHNSNGVFTTWYAYLVWIGGPIDVTNLSAYSVSSPLIGYSAPSSDTTLQVIIQLDQGGYRTYDLPIINDVSVQYSSGGPNIGYHILSGGPTDHIYIAEVFFPLRLKVHGVLSQGRNAWYYTTVPFLGTEPDFYFLYQ